ncbi:MAG: YjgP/YjgQ family permease [Crocinitomicaceae bacterium]|jgi:lipopolysaccharide export system permease protein|nr:YjgP/YjgQ family permease [Crocinitomicaceae bacterium]MBT5403122.1 YjgP/YjgQ family permease [Crocinitomicaceae bacterium]MBT6513616.1 YjgP/YjgQ family permease [Crocinitomicaceae bacterium]
MWKLNWLMFRSFIGPFFLSFTLLVFILDMQFFWLYLDDLLGKGLDWYVIAELLFYASANVIPMALPLSVLLSSTMTYGNLAENLELTALKASGTSFLRMSRPLIMVMILIGTFAFYFSNTLWPTANFKMKALLTDIYKAKSSLMISEGRFSTEIDHFGIRATKKNQETGELTDIVIFDRSSNIRGKNQVGHNYREDIRDYHRDIRAESGFILNSARSEALSLVLHNGQITEELSPDRFQDIKYPFWKIDFETSELNVDLSSMNFDRSNEDIWAQSLEWMSAKQLLICRDSIVLDIPDDYKSMTNFIRSQNKLIRDTFSLKPVIGKFFTEALDLGEKKRIIKSAKARTESQLRHMQRKSAYISGKLRDLNKVQILLHQKFTLSIACIILFFVGAPLGAIVKKGGLGIPVLITIILFLVYYVLARTGQQMAKNEVLSPFIGMWLSSFVLVPIGIFFTLKANRDSVIFDWEFYKKGYQRIFRLKR